jgi:hypothetical protein
MNMCQVKLNLSLYITNSFYASVVVKVVDELTNIIVEVDTKSLVSVLAERH